MEKHSDKASKTLAAMGTVGADWKQTDIRWVYEKRLMPRPVECPVCHGERRVWSHPDVYVPLACPADITDFYKRQDWFRANVAGLVRKNCQNCQTYKRGGKYTGSGFVSTGKVTQLVKVKVLVGYPIWPEGTHFDSRFRRESTDRYCCELCSKSLRSYQVPVVGRSADGAAHGMWVGTDCAKKFLAGLHIRPPVEHKGEEFVMDEVKA